VTLDGTHTFCTPEATDGTGTGGDGLSNEFGIFDPVGFEDAPPGETFPKLGVGLLRRDSAEPYRFSHRYAVEPFPIRVESGAARVAFVCDPLPCRGYAARLEKTLAVAGRRLSIHYRLANVGEKTLRTTEYCHNFLAIDGHAVGPAYRLQVPFATCGRVTEPLLAQGREITWSRTPDHAFYHPMEGEDVQAAQWWELAHSPSGVRVRETVSPGYFRLTLWGTGRVVSPEAFVRVEVAPGETQEWQREYTFDAPHPAAGA